VNSDVNKSTLDRTLAALESLNRSIRSNIEEIDQQKLLVQLQKFSKTIGSFIYKSKIAKRRYVFQGFSDKESIVLFMKRHFGYEIHGRTKPEIITNSVQATMDISYDELLNLRRRFKDERDKPFLELIRKNEDQIRKELLQKSVEEIKEFFRGHVSSRMLVGRRKENLINKIMEDIQRRKSVGRLRENPE